MNVACTCILTAHAFHQHMYVACTCVFPLLVHLSSCANKGLEKSSFELGTEKSGTDKLIGD